MKKIIRRDWKIIGIIIILGLTPLLWTTDGQMIAGHDSGLPFNNIVHFVDRLNVWTSRYGLGADQSFALGGFFIHGLEALISYLGFSTLFAQKIMFVIWFTLPGLSMYALGQAISSKHKYRYAWLISSTFYMFNHFILQAWFVAERTKLSIYIGLPIILALYVRAMRGELGIVKTSALSAFTLLLLNGGGFLPLYGPIFVAWAVFSLFFVITERSKEILKKVLSLSALSILFGVLLNAYWILPYLFNTLQVYIETVESVGGLSGVKGWIDSISRWATYDNLVRLQGIPEWYQNELHPYSFEFLINPILIFLSFLIPIVSWYAVVSTKGRLGRYMALFASLALFSMVFTAGSQPPFGFLYVLFVEHIPGFAVFRTPYYKFGLGLWLAYSIMFGVGAYLLTHRFLSKNKKFFWVGMIMALIVAYSFPFLDGRFFDFEVGKRTTRVSPPQYVFDFFEQNARMSRTRQDRVLLLPEHGRNLKLDQYTWGYWSLAPLPSVATDASFISNSSQLSADERAILEILYEKLRKNDPSWERLAHMLSIDALLLRNDIDWQDDFSRTTDPSFYESILNNSQDVELVQKSGEWLYYTLKNSNNQPFYFSEELAQINSVLDIKHVIELPDIGETPAAIVGNTRIPGLRIRHVMANCANCEQLRYTMILPTVKVDAGSRFYPIIKTLEERGINQIEDPVNKFAFLKELIFKRLSNVIVLFRRGESPERVTFAINELQLVLDRARDHIKTSDTWNEMDANEQYIKSVGELSDFKFQVEEIMKDHVRKDSTEHELLVNIIKSRDRLSEDINTKVWASSSERDKKLFLSIPFDGEYNLIIQKESINISEDITKDGFLDIQVGGGNVRLTLSKEDKNWLTFDAIHFDKGIHKMAILDDESQNLIEYDLESIRADSDVSFSEVGDGKFQIYFNEKREDTCISIPFPENIDLRSRYSMGYLYKISDDRQHITSYVSPKYRQTTPRLTKGRDFLSGSVNAQNYQQFLSPQSQSESTYIHFCADTKSGGSGVAVDIENLYLREVKTPVVFAQLARADNFVGDAKITSTKHSNSEYSVYKNSTNSGVLVFTETFNPDWKVDGEYQGLKANGIFNAWLLPGGEVRLKVEYSPQRLFEISSLISVSSAIALVFVYKHKDLRSYLFRNPRIFSSKRKPNV